MDSFPPLSVAAIRISIAAVVLSLIAILTGAGLPGFRTPTERRIWLFSFGNATLYTSVPFSLLSWGQQYVTSGFAGITMAVVPLSVLPLAHFLVPGEVMSRRKSLGFVIGFIGVVVLIGPRAFLSSGLEWENLARLACLAAALCYAIGSIITRLAPPVAQLSFSAASMLLAALIMVPVAVYHDDLPSQVPLISMAAIAYLGFIPTALAMVMLVTIIRREGPGFLSLVNYQVPVWAVLIGVTFLSEPLPAQFIGALALILTGLAISQTRKRV